MRCVIVSTHRSGYSINADIKQKHIRLLDEQTVIIHVVLLDDLSQLGRFT